MKKLLRKNKEVSSDQSFERKRKRKAKTKNVRGATTFTCEKIILRWRILKHVARTFRIGEQIHVGVGHVVVVVRVRGHHVERRLRRRHQVVLVVDRQVEAEAVDRARRSRSHCGSSMRFLTVDRAVWHVGHAVALIVF